MGPTQKSFHSVETSRSGVQLGLILQRELTALNYLPAGSRVLYLVAWKCGEDWPLPRKSQLGAMTIVRKDALVNSEWRIPGAQILVVRNQARLGWLFFLEFLQTAGFLTLALALSEMVRDNLMPGGLRWFLTGAAIVAVVGAVGVGHFAKDRFTSDEQPAVKKPEPPAAKS